MTILSALIGTLMFGASGYFAGCMIWAPPNASTKSKIGRPPPIQNTAAARNSRNVVDLKDRAMTIGAIRQSAIGLRHANFTRDLPTRPSAFERLGTLKAEADPLADIERDLQETRAIIAELTEQVLLGGEAEKYARGMLKLMTKHRSDLLRLKHQWKQPIR
jgi:hypothetical protein